MSNTKEPHVPDQQPVKNAVQKVIPVDNMYQNWFLDYASYVILERAVPAIEDGLKPVQRRILHAMKEMDDGRYNKVANIIGQTMQYHPHGDASIAEAIVNLGQKELLIDTQGNWGDMRTGDSSAAPRYIEARPAPLANAILYSPAITTWQLSYDGRKKEPVALPVKFPLLLAQGVEGIAVGLSTKILPHNFCELIEGAIAILQNETPTLYPDFPTGGLADCSNYNQGKKGGKVRIRARIEAVDHKKLIIREIPYGTTTTSIIDSIIQASEKGKIKIKQVVDNTAENVEILVYLAPGQSPEVTINALYVFTDCEVNISPNACVIQDMKPVFVDVNTLLADSTERTKGILKQELELQHHSLQEKILFASLERIFIEHKIYQRIEDCETWDAVLQTIQAGLTPYTQQFHRTITLEDITSLTEIKIKRISKYDLNKAVDTLRAFEKELKTVQNHLNKLTAYTIQYYRELLKKYGAGRERKTIIQTFEAIKAQTVVATNQKLYVDRKQGFIGYGMKKEELVGDCSDIDDVLIIRKDGKCMITKVTEKGFVGKDIIHIAIYNKDGATRTYHLIYQDGTSGIAKAKRLQIKGLIRDKEYELTAGTPGSAILYLTAHPAGNTEVVTVTLSPKCTARNKVFDFDFADLAVKGKSSQGNIVTKYPVKKIQPNTKSRASQQGLF